MGGRAQPLLVAWEGFRAGQLAERVIPTFLPLFLRRIYPLNGLPIVFGEEPEKSHRRRKVAAQPSGPILHNWFRVTPPQTGNPFTFP